ncbi:MAG TPA: c-type cytochrome [Vicinamibacterales bacterium]|nr:c-type cytochrome [Vicinamibacterales bacterium]
MTHSRLFAALAFAILAVTAGAGFQAGPPWPPSLQRVAAESPVLSPAEELKTIFMPPGYHLELVASEPLVQDPVVMDWDSDGRLWVVEMPGYMIDIQASREHDPLGRIVVLQDTNKDGRMDKRTVFADGLVLPRALKVLDNGALVGEPPNLWFMPDANHDLKADSKIPVTGSYGRLESNVEHNANSLLWALDNWIYTSETDVFLRLKNGKFETRKTLARGQWGASQDDGGRVFRNSNESALHVDLVPTYYFSRNAALTRTRGSDEFLGPAGEDLNAVWPVRPTPGVNRGYQAGVLREDGSLARFSAACAPTVYRGDRLPAELYGSVFVAEPAGNLVSRIVVTDDGTTLRGRKAYERGEFIASTDERFRPVYLSSAPDGTLYVVDLYRGIVQHRGFITEYLRDQILSRALEQPIDRGRIWRVVHDTTRRGPVPALSKAAPAALVEALSHPNGWWRDTAQQLLVQRNDKSVVAALQKLAVGTAPARTRLHALWTLDGIDSLTPADVTRALADSSRDVRVSAVRLSERWLREGDAPMRTAVLAMMADTDWAVREQLAASLGELPAATKEAAMAAFLERHAGDPVAMDAALSGLASSEVAVLETLMRATEETPQRSTAITMLVATIVSSAQDGPIQKVFDTVAQDTRPAWQRSALLKGAEVSLLSAEAPGSRGRGRSAAAADAPCPTCPGGRAGPGGASAFPRAPGAAADAGEGAPAAAPGRGGRGRGTARPALKLTREPALVGLAAANAGELSSRATALVARLEWPGKPGMAAPVAALSAAELARFDAGRTVYQTLCQACHQPNGRGMEKLAPSLIGSEFALASTPTIPIRIVLNGKEGSVGLMPPLGGALTDEQVAAALTYIRREWGHTASPIDPAVVAQTRRETAGRTRPWTTEELTRMLRGGL